MGSSDSSSSSSSSDSDSDKEDSRSVSRKYKDLKKQFGETLARNKNLEEESKYSRAEIDSLKKEIEEFSNKIAESERTSADLCNEMQSNMKKEQDISETVIETLQQEVSSLNLRLEEQEKISTVKYTTLKEEYDQLFNRNSCAEEENRSLLEQVKSMEMLTNELQDRIEA